MQQERRIELVLKLIALREKFLMVPPIEISEKWSMKWSGGIILSLVINELGTIKIYIGI